MDWNDEAIARLRGLWDEGHSTAEIGRRLGITKNAVVGKAHRLNLPARPSPIRRSLSDAVARVPAVRRVSGPTLTPLQPQVVSRRAAPVPGAAGVSGAAAPVASARSASARSASAVVAVAAKPLPTLRAVPTVPRPAARVPACCWPIGEPGTPTFHFCGDPAMGGKPYCSDHAAIAYVKVRDRREDAA